jgi:hypothetical protein
LGIALLAFAGTALFSTAAADGIACGSVVSPQLASIEQSIDFARFVAGQIDEPPEQLTHGAEQALHACRSELAERRAVTIGTGSGGLLLLLGPFAVTALRRHAKPKTSQKGADDDDLG